MGRPPLSKVLNEAGGINGHPVKLIQCDSKGDPATEVQRAQTLVANHVVATLSDMTVSHAAQVNQILAGIPRIGITMADTSDYSNLDNFPTTGGGIFNLVGTVQALINKGDKKISMIINDAPTAGQLHLLIDPIVESQGAKVAEYVLVSPATGDFSQYVVPAQEYGAQGIASGLANVQEVQFDQAFSQLKPKIDFAAGISGYSLNQLKQLEPMTTKTIFADWTPALDDTANFPGLAQPIAALTANIKGATVNNLTSLPLLSWLAIHAFYEVMKSQSGTPDGCVDPGSLQSGEGHRDERDLEALDAWGLRQCGHHLRSDHQEQLEPLHARDQGQWDAHHVEHVDALQHLRRTAWDHHFQVATARECRDGREASGICSRGPPAFSDRRDDDDRATVSVSLQS